MLSVPSLNLRHAVRAILLTDDGDVLLCRHLVNHPPVLGVWTAPGGRIERGETPFAALQRELQEEVGLTIGARPPHVWHREVVGTGYAPGYDGAVSDYFLVRTAAFTPHGTMSDDELARENLIELRWWSLPDIVGYRGPDVFGPRDLGNLLAALMTDGVPVEPIAIGV